MLDILLKPIKKHFRGCSPLGTDLCFTYSGKIIVISFVPVTSSDKQTHSQCPGQM